MPFKKGEIPKGAKPFKKGQSGNPAGKPKLPDLKGALAKYLSEEDGGIDKLEKVIKKLTEMAEKGNLKAMEMLLDRGYGKPQQKIDHTTLGERITPPISWENE